MVSQISKKSNPRNRQNTKTPAKDMFFMKSAANSEMFLPQGYKRARSATARIRTKIQQNFMWCLYPCGKNISEFA
ncbi:MAG: hypothetical protein A3E07_03550 [Candidatus Wildermuthbacteria bacterium RIFCSPHIGHO2_12_FULL_45_9]|uniref:Uncharacterized protein n=1 Tax=Candidatus Wildermuthbacteria bacterium RIFCSPHIGHO2_02_FULL_45_25 TaxID=1802450 RepID=A0A1G2R385_9BACT|nr:MAG: hypothetical protein A2748_00115 [Candidatus Wildermuthbacteria bacterium RIFCSPHIGHO2_01_FULL_45_20]OHA67310.1 MAG: hypothetical protein A3C04_01140 [Candidatus Wildermuthbacteria bacterium RIFCSPHIGHO2_02_FULL_45_25]OHA71129.1 MAG: hypothetical protein A3E07_03550 [Candidatus Wildermuthbacteria bacterium RIFCSPHIGHO2_12_FULL_45_9]